MIDAGALEYEATLAGDKDGQVLLAVPERAFVVPTCAIVEGQLMRKLPGVLKKQIKSLYVDQTCRIPERDG